MGTAILTREHMPIQNIARLPTGRRLAAESQRVPLVNIYAQSGTERQQEREAFFNSDLPYLLRAIPTTMVVVDEFNCALTKTDTTGHFNYSKALNELVKGFELVDMWALGSEGDVYTRYTRRVASRLDRI
jgi:exonuclease III